MPIHDMVWYCVICCDVKWCDVTLYDMIYHVLLCYAMVRCHVTWHDVLWYVMHRYGMSWHGVTWLGLIHHDMTCSMTCYDAMWTDVIHDMVCVHAMMLCVVSWYDTALYVMLKVYMTWGGMIRYGMAWYEFTWHKLAWFDVIVIVIAVYWIAYGVAIEQHLLVVEFAQHHMVYHALELYGMVCCNMIWHVIMIYGISLHALALHVLCYGFI